MPSRVTPVIPLSETLQSTVPGAGAQPDAGLEDLLRILDEEMLLVRFRPVASLADCAVFAHLAEVSGPQDVLVHEGERLFAAAARLGELARLTRLAFSTIAAMFMRSGVDGHLLLPLPAAAVATFGADLVKILDESLATSGIVARRVVVAVPWLGWQATDREMAVAAAMLSACRGRGLVVADGAVGCGLANRHLWADAPADFVLLDDGLLASVDADLMAGGRLPEVLSRVTARGSRVIAQGIGNARELRVAERLGIDLVAGDYIGHANAEPSQILAAAAYKRIRRSCTSPRGDADSAHLLERLMIKVSPVTRDTPADEVFATFEGNPQLRAVAVVDGNVPVGIIARFEMLDNMARPYRHELYGKRSCTRFMDREPIVTDLRRSLPELTDLLVHADPRHLVSGFIVTVDGRYAGLGSVQDLVREITAMQVEAARYANPLTQLPGNVPLAQHVDELLAAGEPFVLCCCDLDHFKPFNDVYGYARGDEVIALTGRILAECCDNDSDFVGHVGGDDFILAMRSPDWQARCRRALKLFEEEILGFFSRDDIERGGYVTEDRNGAPDFHRLTALSVGAVEVAPGQFVSHLQIAGIAAEVQRKAKGVPGNSLYVNQRHYAAADGAVHAGADG